MKSSETRQNTSDLQLTTPSTGLEKKPSPSFNYILEELRRRYDTKTIVLEESLRRCEYSQRRFWGINE